MFAHLTNMLPVIKDPHFQWTGRTCPTPLLRLEVHKNLFLINE
jgi:hypothetical protein